MRPGCSPPFLDCLSLMGKLDFPLSYFEFRFHQLQPKEDLPRQPHMWGDRRKKPDGVLQLSLNYSKATGSRHGRKQTQVPRAAGEQGKG